MCNLHLQVQQEREAVHAHFIQICSKVYICLKKNLQIKFELMCISVRCCYAIIRRWFMEVSGANFLVKCRQTFAEEEGARHDMKKKTRHMMELV